MHRLDRSTSGFTLAELLIALAILGEIATFTIPKILSSQTNARNNAVAKEAMSTLAASFQQLQMSGTGVSTRTSVSALSQYINYVSVDTSSTVDALPTGSNLPCYTTYVCLKLHSGGILFFDSTQFGTTNGYIDAVIDPNGTFSGNKDSLGIIITYRGRITDFGTYFSMPSTTPTWFSY